jgi:pimeloyl-ACP methyl ester carboxylesterase
MTDPIAPWPGELVAVGTGEVFVRSAPAPEGAEPALFVHGLGGSATNWTDLIDLLRRPRADGPDEPVLACEALDLPGFGFSPVLAGGAGPGGAGPGGAGPGGAGPGGASPSAVRRVAARPGGARSGGVYSIDAMAGAVCALIEKRGYWPVHLVGNSMGGAVCVRVAARRPELVRTLTLIAPALPDLRPRLLPMRLTVLCVPRVGPWLLNRVQQRVSAADRTAVSFRDVYADPTLVHPKRLAEETAELERRDGLGYAGEVLLGAGRGLVAEYLRRGPRSLWHDAARVTAPTLVIYGSHDRLVRPAMAAPAARAFRGARAVVLSRTGHVAMMEHPGLVAKEMRELFAGARRPVQVTR